MSVSTQASKQATRSKMKGNDKNANNANNANDKRLIMTIIVILVIIKVIRLKMTMIVSNSN